MESKITLGATDYPIAPLSLGQMRQVAPCFMRMGVDSPEGMAAQITIIFQAIKAANPAAKMEEIDAIKGVTLEQIRMAVETIGKLIGLEVKSKVLTPGEAPPADGPASQNGTGDTSTQS